MRRVFLGAAPERRGFVPRSGDETGDVGEVEGIYCIVYCSSSGSGRLVSMITRSTTAISGPPFGPL